MTNLLMEKCMLLSAATIDPSSAMTSQWRHNACSMSVTRLRVIFLAMVALLFLATIPPAHASQEATGSATTSGFEPLDRWKAAVLAGNQPALKLLYIASPQSYAVTPQGKINDPADEESQFWSALHGQGLTAVSAKILQRGQPEPGVEQMVLRIELTFQSKGETQRNVIGGVQIWGQLGNDWRIFVSQRTESGALPQMRLPEPSTPNIHLYPEPADAAKELDEALASAKSDHKRVLVVFGANWCYDCHVLDEAMNSAKSAPLVAANYHVVHINIGDGKDNSALANRFLVPLDKGIPSLAVVDAGGEVVTSQKQGEFESAAKIGMSDVIDFLERWKPTAGK
jgi:thioredoxin 1